jgi:cytoskeletal protein RodZ
MENKNKNLLVWIAVVLIVVVSIVVWVNKSSAPTVVQNTTPATGDNTALQVINSTEDTSTGSVNVGATAATIAYSDALIKYANARLQLDKTCQALASPANLTFKNNAYLMIDNRAPVARTVKVGSTFSIKAYGFKIVKLYSAKLPATWLVDCDKSQNVATILIQK